MYIKGLIAVGLLILSQASYGSDFSWMNFTTFDRSGDWIFVKERREQGAGAGFTVWNRVRVGVVEKDDANTFLSLEKLNCTEQNYDMAILVATEPGQSPILRMGYPGWFEVDGVNVAGFSYAAQLYNGKAGYKENNIVIFKVELKELNNSLTSKISTGSTMSAHLKTSNKDTVELQFSLKGSSKALADYSGVCKEAKNITSRKSSKLF